MDAVTLTCPSCKKQASYARVATKCPRCSAPVGDRLNEIFGQVESMKGKKVVIASQRVIRDADGQQRHSPPILVTDMATMEQFDGSVIEIHGPSRMVYREDVPLLIPQAGEVRLWLETEGEVTLDGKKR